MGAVGGVAILGGNFEAATFPEDKVVQRSLTAGTQESSAIDAVILDALPLGAPGQLDSHAFLWKGHSNDGSPHTIDWKAFVNVTADDGTGSLWTLQTRIDGAPYTDILTVDDNGLLTVSGATFTMDQLIIDSDNTEAVIVRKDGDAGDVFIVDTVNDVVRLGSNDTFLTFGASSDARLERFGPRDIGMREPGVGGVGLGAGGENTLRLYARDDVAGSAARFLELKGDGPICLVKANRFAGGGQFDLNLDVNVGKIAFFNEGVQRWNIQGSVTADFEFAPFITNRYDLGSAALAVRNLYTNGVLIGQDKTSAYDAITIDGTDLAAPGQQDSGAIILTGLSNDGSAHDIDWKQFVNVTANAGTGSIWTLQARIDAASFVDEFTITATTSPTLAHIGPGSTDGALAFGPIGAAGPAQSGTIRFRNTDDVRWRNSGDDDDNVWFSIGASDQLILGETTSGPFIGVVPGLRAFDSIECTSDTGNLTMSGASLSPIIFKADGANQDVTIGEGVVLLPSSSVDRLIVDAPNLTVNSTVGFSHTFLMVGKSREAGGANHDSNWRMFVEPLTGTGFDGQSVFKITAAIDGAGPTTVFTLSDTGDLIVPGSFTIDGLIIDVTSTEAFLVRKDGDTEDIFIVDTTNEAVRLASDDTFLAWGAASDAQMHRGDAADIIEQRRGLNPQEWRLYDRFVSHADYDRLAIYIGGGPPLKTIEFVAETTNGSQGISIEIEAIPGGSSDGRLTLINGQTQFQLQPSSASLQRTFNITSAGTSTLTLGGFLSTLGAQVGTSGIGIKMDIAGQGSSDFEDSHKFDMIGAGELANRATWRTFVDVINVGGDSIWTLQDDKNGGGFVTNFSITDDGGFNFPLPLPSHAIGAVIDLSSQLTLSGDYFSLLSGGTTASRFKTEDRITGATGQTVGLFQAWFGGNIRTQTATESVSNIATVVIDEPNILDNLTGSITNASSLLITGAPTEGVSNYALRIASGDIVIDDTAAILFDLGTDFSALSVAPTGRLEMGLSGAPWGRITFYSAFVTAVGVLRVEATAAEHGAQTDMQTRFTDVATSAGSSVTAAGLIPAASFVIGVTVRVLTTVTGPTGFDVGDGIDVDRWGNSILVAAGTVSNISSFTSGSVTTFQVANDVVITSDGVDFTGGSIRITVHYTTLQTSAA